MKLKINLPTKITISRIVIAFLLIVAMIVMFIIDQFTNFIVNANIEISSSGATINWIMLILFLVFILASATDALDGYLARKNNQVTDLGKFLDPIADKMLVNSMLILLAMNFPSLGDSINYPFFCVVLMVIRDLVVDGMRLMAAKKQVVVSANIFGKAKTVLQMLSISLVFLNGFPFSYFDYTWMNYLHITDFVCYITTIVSLLSGTIYLIQNRFVLGGEENE